MKTVKIAVFCLVLSGMAFLTAGTAESVPDVSMDRNVWSARGDSGWWDFEVKHSGDYSMRVENDDTLATSAWVSVYVDVKPDTTYRLAGWMKYKDVVPNPDNGQGVAVNYAVLRNEEGVHTNVSPGWWGEGTSDGWVKQERVFRTRPDTVTLMITPRMVRASGKAWFDTISLEEIEEYEESPPPAERPREEGVSVKIEKGEYKGLTATASSVMGEHSPDRAFDSDLTTYWVPSRMPCWIQIDLGEDKEIGRIFWNGDRGAGYNNRIPENYRFTVSSTGEFRGEEKVVAGKEGNRRNSSVTHIFAPVRARYVRMEIYTAYGANPQPTIDRIEITPPPYRD